MRRAGVIWGSAIGLLLALLTAGHALVPVSQMLYDVIAVITSPRRADPRVALIVIDQESIDRLGAFPWSREVHARLLDRLAPAKASSIAFNIAFTESSASDEALADAMRRAGNVYLPVLRNVRRVAPLITYDPPPSQLVLAAAGLGHIGASLDSDGVVRRVAIEDAIGQEGYLPIGVIASLPRLGVSLADLVSPTQGHYHIGSLDIPINGSMETSLGYSGGPDVFPQFSYVEVLEGEVSPDEFRDRIVIIGAAAEGLGDRHPTPFSRWGAPPMTGVELHANVAAMLL
ncbi:MAG: CHASE2 domain-containing protein, partial [Chloroflexi bacterium]|nr:CHASE2 domain-containing protein [Chloroflexota bacterium]